MSKTLKHFWQNIMTIPILRLQEMTPRGVEIVKIFLGEAPRPPPARNTSIPIGRLPEPHLQKEK